MTEIEPHAFSLQRHYHCLLGELPEGIERLRKACRMDNQWKEQALGDPDLKAIWGDIEAIK